MSKKQDTLSGLRRRCRDLVETREVFEKRLVRRREYFQGSLSTIEHPNKTGPSTPYYYISCKKDLKRLKTLNEDIAKILEKIVGVQTVMDVNDDR